MGLDPQKSLKVRVSLFKYVSQVFKLVVLQVQTFLLSAEKGLNGPVRARANILHSTDLHITVPSTGQRSNCTTYNSVMGFACL